MKTYYKSYFLLLLFCFVGFQSCQRSGGGGSRTANLSDREAAKEVNLKRDDEYLRVMTDGRLDLPDSSIKKAVEQQVMNLNQRTFFKDRSAREALTKALQTFYADRDYRLAWNGGDGLLPQVDSLLLALQAAPADGLSPNDYPVNDIVRARAAIFSDSIDRATLKLGDFLQLDFLLTSTFLTYAKHLHAGRVDPNELHEQWYLNVPEGNYAKALEDALQQNRVQTILYSLRPEEEQYGLLREQLAAYRELAKQGGWPKINPAKGVLEKGDREAAVAVLKKRLILTNDLTPDNAYAEDSTYFDEALAAAVASFQEHQGTKVDSAVGPTTLTLLNVPVEQRIQQLALNMERIRWMPRTRGDYYLQVNIPEFKLHIYRKGKEDLSMRVIVGKDFTNETPIFSDSMSYIVFSPTWTVPLSIGRDEILPHLIKDPTWLDRNNYDIYRTWHDGESPMTAKEIAKEKWADIDPEEFKYRVVQRPGDGNALGRAKFIFPNNMNIYLHDTPGHHLFSQEVRDLSHGCVRVEFPAQLAEYLLDDRRQWDTEKIDEAMHQEEPVTVTLPEKLPVNIIYQTAWVNQETGRVSFWRDVYGYDDAQLNALGQEATPLAYETTGR
ncbi:Murein L,D-transpeptidase YcbB/YkuD [Catalinimonas alkaloidigena]|uniref:Murein L,D-transpeptidase YcbB/YkuD n=1 Tax=Catalinimonas alkaloidigena TaxID=1075417 RepID=A0A1G8WXX7_9BACT|nr:L,D-transpeptidase family protein [Catalinimonas alkaloidigena]SDJ82926.1 Murein L,D-transpeptidase YcbB/YkuD [Catalinimonas alkaloidigena]